MSKTFVNEYAEYIISAYISLSKISVAVSGKFRITFEKLNAHTSHCHFRNLIVRNFLTIRNNFTIIMLKTYKNMNNNNNMRFYTQMKHTCVYKIFLTKWNQKTRKNVPIMKKILAWDGGSFFSKMAKRSL